MNASRTYPSTLVRAGIIRDSRWEPRGPAVAVGPRYALDGIQARAQQVVLVAGCAYPLPVNQHSQLRRDGREGLDTAELAHRFKLTRATIRLVLRAHQRATGENLSRLPRQRPGPVFTLLEKRRAARNCRIICLCRDGHDIREIAIRFRLTPGSIYRILEDHRRAAEWQRKHP